jgi:hypothetical protein
MGRIWLAFRIFFRTLFSAPVAEQVQGLLGGETLPKIIAGEKSKHTLSDAKIRPTIAETPQKRSEAITLLAALQREARLVDLVQQPLGSFTDEQVGAVARSVLRDSAAVLARFFVLKPVLSESEGSEVQVHAAYDPGRFKLSGNVGGNPPYHGKLAHAGWEATTINLPSWTGSKDSANIIAPAEVEVS